MIKNIVILLVAVVLGYAFGRYAQPARVETKIVTQIKTVEVESKNVKTTTTETTKPDGTKVVTTTTQDNSVITDNTNSVTKSDTVKDNRAQWKVTAQLSPTKPQLYYFYGAEVDRRILGPIFAGAYMNVDKNFGVSIGLEF